MRASPRELPIPPAPPILRLRYVLAVSIAALGVWGTLPRAEAAFKLPTLSTLLADYALCMVGPTGPSLVRDNAAGFHALVRRRLVTSGPDDQPFARCAKAARDLTGEEPVERAHLS